MDIAALLSGGVDSSVVVHLLCEQGYKPTLFYIKIGMDGAEYMDCSAEEDIELSTATARKYGLSLEVVDLHQEYWENVAAYAIDKIRQGLTPNPDVMCNKQPCAKNSSHLSHKPCKSLFRQKSEVSETYSNT